MIPPSKRVVARSVYVLAIVFGTGIMVMVALWTTLTGAAAAHGAGFSVVTGVVVNFLALLSWHFGIGLAKIGAEMLRARHDEAGELLDDAEDPT